MTDDLKVLYESKRRYIEEKSLFLLVSTEEEFDAYMNKQMDKEMFSKCIEICERYCLINLFNELAGDYGGLLDEIVDEIEKDIEFTAPIPQCMEDDMEEWYRNLKSWDFREL